MSVFLWIILIFLASIGIIFLVFYVKYLIPLRGIEDGFKYVFVENDGTVRELDHEEIKYLSEVFHPNDGGRPYIKTRYSEKTPEGQLSGFILRRRVPKHIEIKTLSAQH